MNRSIPMPPDLLPTHLAEDPSLETATEESADPFEKLEELQANFGRYASEDATDAQYRQLMCWQKAFMRIFLCCVDRPLSDTEKVILKDVKSGLEEILV